MSFNAFFIAFTSLVLADPPLILFGGFNPGGNMSGFLFPDVRHAPEVDFFSQVNTVICSHQEKVVVGTSNSVSDAAPEIDRVAVQRMDGEVRSVLEIETRLDANTIASGMILVGGIFSGGLSLWDRFGVQTVGPSALVPPCVLSLAYVSPTATPPRSTAYVAGCFQRMGTMILNGVARIHFASGFLPTNEHPKWESLGDGFQAKDGGAASVFCIVAMNDIVYAGGEFALSGSTPVRNIARYNVHLKKWSNLGGGVEGIVRSIAPSSHSEYNGVYIGGSFCSVNSPAICNIAYWDSQSGWSTLGNGVTGEVLSLLLVGPILYVGGEYVCADTIKSNLGAWLESDNKWFSGRLPGGERPGIIRTITQCPCARGSALADNGDCQTDEGLPSAVDMNKSGWRKGGGGRYVPLHHRNGNKNAIAAAGVPYANSNVPQRGTFMSAVLFIGCLGALAGPVAYVLWKRKQRSLEPTINWHDAAAAAGVEGVPLMTYHTYGGQGSAIENVNAL